MLKVTSGCSVIWGLDGTTLEHPFPALKRNSLDVSQGICREESGSRGVRTHLTCIQRRRWLSLQVRRSCSVSWPWLASFPGQRTWPDTHEQSSQIHPTSRNLAKCSSCWQWPGAWSMCLKGSSALWLHYINLDGIFWKKPRHRKLQEIGPCLLKRSPHIIIIIMMFLKKGKRKKYTTNSNNIPWWVLTMYLILFWTSYIH